MNTVAKTENTGVSSPSLAERFLKNFEHPTEASLDGAAEYCIMRAEESIAVYRATKDLRYSEAAAEYLTDALRLQKAKELVTVTNPTAFDNEGVNAWRHWAVAVILACQPTKPFSGKNYSDEELQKLITDIMIPK